MSTRDLSRCLRRIRAAVSHRAYLTPTHQVPSSQQRALQSVAEGLAADRPIREIQAQVEQLTSDGVLDQVGRCSALSVIASHPRVSRFDEAIGYAEQQEMLALGLPEQRRPTALASAHRHRGVIAFLRLDMERALEHFSTALEHERSVENLGNVLAALLALGLASEAEALARPMLDGPVGVQLRVRICDDDDLSSLRGMLVERHAVLH